jgi:hypothetical protein
VAGGRAPYQKEWRTLPWLAGYEVSEDGDVRHTSRKATRPAGYVLKGCVQRDGYRIYKLTVFGFKRIYKAHRLVCEAFHGRPPNERMEVAHFDGNPANNHYTNLRWASRQENDRDRVAHGTDPRGERNPRAILDWSKVREIRARYTGKRGQMAELAAEYGLTRGGMAQVVYGRTWRE